MIQLGMSGIRLNLSHGGLAERQDWVRALFEAEESSGRPVEFLIDLCGPEMRIELPGEEFRLCEAQSLYLSAKESRGRQGEPRHTPAPEIFVPGALLRELRRGDRLSVNDGSVLLAVEEAAEQLRCKAVRGGLIAPGKSISLSGREIPLPALSAGDLENLCLAEQSGVTAVMQSFTSCGEDVRALRSELAALGLSRLQIFAKIETGRGLEQLKEIAAEADQIVIARGDLGNTMGLTRVPYVQRKISEYCRRHRIPFMVVTELLSSMLTESSPTQAEVSDIARAVWDGAGALMLTGETAVGAHPEEAMRWLVEIAAEAGRES